MVDLMIDDSMMAANNCLVFPQCFPETVCQNVDGVGSVGSSSICNPMNGHSAHNSYASRPKEA